MVYGPTQSDPVGGDHGDLIAALAAFLKPQTYLELGVLNGETFDKVAPHCRIAVGVDVNIPTHRSDDPRFIRGDTVAYLKTLPAASIEFIFLDSSHESTATMAELAEIERVLAPNGVLAMHDTYPPNEEQEQPGRCGDVWRVGELLLERKGWEAMTLPAQYGVTLARKLPEGWKHLAWK